MQRRSCTTVCSGHDTVLFTQRRPAHRTAVSVRADFQALKTWSTRRHIRFVTTNYETDACIACTVRIVGDALICSRVPSCMTVSWQKHTAAGHSTQAGQPLLRLQSVGIAAGNTQLDSAATTQLPGTQPAQKTNNNDSNRDMQGTSER